MLKVIDRNNRQSILIDESIIELYVNKLSIHRIGHSFSHRDYPNISGYLGLIEDQDFYLLIQPVEIKDERFCIRYFYWLKSLVLPDATDLFDDSSYFEYLKDQWRNIEVLWLIKDGTILHDANQLS